MRLLGRQIKRVGLRDNGTKVVGGDWRQGVPVFPFQTFEHVLRQLHAVGRKRHYVCFEASERADQRMNRSAVLKIPADDDRQTLQFALFFFQSVEVTEGLGGMLVSA